MPYVKRTKYKVSDNDEIKEELRGAYVIMEASFQVFVTDLWFIKSIVYEYKITDIIYMN